MKFLSKDNFQLLVRVLQHHIEITSKDQGILYHIMKFIDKQNLDIKEKNKNVIKLFYDQRKEKNPLEHLSLPDEITKAYFVPINQQRNITDIQIDNDTSTFEFKKVFNESLSFMEMIHNQPIKNRNKDIIIPETIEIIKLREQLYNSIYDSIYLAIDSRDRQFNDETYNMRIDLDKTIKQIYSIELISAEIPKIEYLINENNNILHFQETAGITLQAVIPIGNYTINDLITEVRLQLNSVGSSTYNVSLINDRIKITSDLTGGSNIFTLCFDGGTENYGFKTRSIYKTNSIGDILGFMIDDKIGSNNYTANEKYKLDGESNVYLHFTNIDCQKKYDQGAFAVISLDVEHGDVLYFTNNSYYKINHSFSPMLQLDHLNIQLKTYINNFYKTGEWSFLLKINYIK